MMNKKLEKKKMKKVIRDLIEYKDQQPFKNKLESEKFYKKIFLEEMNLENNFNEVNLNKLLGFYVQGMNIYQNSSCIDKFNLFNDKLQLLLQSSEVQELLSKKSNIDRLMTQKDKSLIYNFDIIVPSEKEKESIQNKNNILEENSKKEKKENGNKMNYLKKINQKRTSLNLQMNLDLIRKELEEEDIRNRRFKEINKQYKQIDKEKNKTSLFLENEIKRQSTFFKKKLATKRISKKIICPLPISLKKPAKKLIKSKSHSYKKNKNISSLIKIERIMSIIFDENIKFPERKVKTPKIDHSKKRIEMLLNEERISDKEELIKNKDLKDKIFENIEEYNKYLYKYQFLPVLNKILSLIDKKHITNKEIYDSYQLNIKELLQKKLSSLTTEDEEIKEEEINNLKEEQNHEIAKNDDLYEKIISEEISLFKVLGYSKYNSSSLKELAIFKDKFKCLFYNELEKKLNK